MRGRAVLLGSVALVVALGGLMVGVRAALDGVAARTAAVNASVRTLSAYQGVQRSIANEAFAEAGYRRSPNPASRSRLEASIGDVQQSVARVRRLQSAHENGTVNYLLILNRRYESQVRGALRAGDKAAATTPDDRVAGPALDAIQGLVDAAVSRQQQLADRALSQ